MSYKPNYCCECGEEIDRVEWNFFASRRFCQLCETQYKLEDWMPSAAVVLAVLFGLIGVGSFFQSAEQPLKVEAKQFVESKNKAVKGAVLQNEVSGDKQVQVIPPEDVQSRAEVESPGLSAAEKVKGQPHRIEQKEAAMPVYFCGAETKKGTPCSRHVKGGGRCFQHKGRDAVLPQKDLLVGR